MRVHALQNLDGEMQKLVYDNYNKFITATETIKEMKSDVYSMDNDMNSVRSTMKVIAQNSQQLDGIFEVKRQQVSRPPVVATFPSPSSLSSEWKCFARAAVRGRGMKGGRITLQRIGACIAAAFF